MNNNLDKQKMIDAIVSSSGGQIDRNKLNSVASSGEAQALLAKLSPQDQSKVMSALNDEAALKNLLKSKQAQALLNSFLKGPGK